MPTVKLILEYDGSRYAGWQRQPDQPTIQEAVETALFQLTQETVSVIGAGRTDAGVPESFNVLVKEIRSLGIDIELDRS